MSSATPLHHLPRRAHNLLYIAALALSPLINLLISVIILQEFRSSRAHAFASENWVAGISQFVLGGILVFLGINLVRTMFLKHHRIRETLLVFGLLCTLDLVLNLLTITYGIYVFKVGSFFLLLISIGIYFSLNLIFFFWYWYVDYPSQVRHLHHPEEPCEILFPREAVAGNPHWIPTWIDYLYFTLMTSNTLGPPENHSPMGVRIKVIQLLHSGIMLILLVILVSRAVNTLS